MLYWLQLHEKIGPVVINMSRVLIDIFSMIGAFTLVALAFTSGLVFILTTEVSPPKKVPLNSTVYDNEISAYSIAFGETFILLIWTIFDPGQKDEISSQGLRGVFATIVLLAYQIITIIILLNLLIAVMNSTIQRFQDRKQLYWKYTRTSVWIDFFDDHAAIPSPFVIIEIFWASLIFFHNACVWLVKFCKRSRKDSMFSLHNVGACQPNDEVTKARVTHAKLMIKLLERYRDKIKEETEEQSGLESLKHDLIRHMESFIKSK